MNTPDFTDLAKNLLTPELVASYKSKTEKEGLPRLFKTLGLIVIALALLRAALEYIPTLYAMPPLIALVLIWIPPILLLAPSLLYSRKVKKLTNTKHLQTTLTENLEELSCLLPSSLSV